ncbi:hypothetical protein LDC_1489, partial [sediment metagenome]
MTGFNVMLNNLGSSLQYMYNLNTLCDDCTAGQHCEVRKYTLLSSQKLSFDMVGMTTAPVRTTMGACSCEDPAETDCWFDLSLKCGYPV